jgi:Tfp pilus assembly protein PilN
MSTINLLPDDYIQESSQRRANVMCLILFAITMTAVVGAVVYCEQRGKGIRAVRDQVDVAYSQAARQLVQMQQMESRRLDMLDKAQTISALLEKVPRSHLLGVIANALPENTSIYKLEVDSRRIVSAPAAAKSPPTKAETLAAAKVPKVAATVVTIDIVGLAGTDVDVAKLIANLARNPLTASVDLVYSQEKMIEKTPVREFQIHVDLKNSADALTDTQIAEAPARTDQSAGVTDMGGGQ